MIDLTQEDIQILLTIMDQSSYRLEGVMKAVVLREKLMAALDKPKNPEPPAAK